jgi:hypothetical protein
VPVDDFDDIAGQLPGCHALTWAPPIPLFFGGSAHRMGPSGS